MGFFRSLLSLLGRLMLCSYFAWLGARYWMAFDDTVARWQAVGIPEPKYAVWGAIACLGLGCLFVLTGLAARFGALLLLIYLVAFIYYFQPFWTLPANQRLPQLVDALRSVALAGALTMLVGNGAGAASLGGFRRDTFEDFDR